MKIGYNGQELAELSDLVGMTMTRVETGEGADQAVFTSDTGRVFKLYHQQDFCESVYVESVVGDLSDLVGLPITMADETWGSMEVEDGTGTWTFYKFATAKGFVDIRWVGESNGYYSEGVDFEEVIDASN